MAKQPDLPEPQLSQYEAMVATQPDVQRKGKTMPYTSLNGNMFSFMAKDGLVAVRLSDEEREKFLKKHPGSAVQQYGKTMKGYVEVPEEILSNKRRARALFARSYAFAQTLKAKPSKRKP